MAWWLWGMGEDSSDTSPTLASAVITHCEPLTVTKTARRAGGLGVSGKIGAAAEELQTWLMMDIQLPISHEAQLKHTHFESLIFILWLMS